MGATGSYLNPCPEALAERKGSRTNPRHPVISLLDPQNNEKTLPRGDSTHNESALTTSPAAIVFTARQVTPLIVLLTKRTEPSPIAQLTPPA